MSVPKVSVLVPVCNVERYLEQCLDSLTAQTMQELEILLIDDGSTDSCPAICDRFAERDPRFRVIHKPNSGYGASMNMGIDQARGEYIGIVESDDFVEPDMFARLYAQAEKLQAQVVKADYFFYRSSTGDKLAGNAPAVSDDAILNPQHDPSVFYLPPAVWSCLYRRSWLNEREIRFLESPGASYQDLGFTLKVFISATQVGALHYPVYHYRTDNPGSSVRATGKHMCLVHEFAELDRFLHARNLLAVKELPWYVLIKLAHYMGNDKRHAGAAKEEFRAAIVDELLAITRIPKPVKQHLPLKYLCFIYNIISPNTRRTRWFNRIYAISKIFLKSKIRRNQKEWYILLGIVKIRRTLPVDFA